MPQIYLNMKSKGYDVIQGEILYSRKPLLATMIFENQLLFPLIVANSCNCLAFKCQIT